MRLWFLVTFPIGLLISGCVTSERAGTPGPYQHSVDLRSDMTDQEIIKKLGYENVLMKKKRVEGPDGDSVTYTNSEGDKVLVTRSIVTGTYIKESRRITRDWELGPRLMAK